MNILLDCDGILSDFVGGVIGQLNDMGHDVAVEDVTEWDELISEITNR